MSEAYEGAFDLEELLADALRPIEPPESLVGRLEDTLSAVTHAAASELSDWADEVSDSEQEAMKDPRNWVRPVAAAAIGSVAGGALLLLEKRRRGRKSGARAALDNLLGGK